MCVCVYVCVCVGVGVEGVECMCGRERVWVNSPLMLLQRYIFTSSSLSGRLSCPVEEGIQCAPQIFTNGHLQAEINSSS